MNYYLILHSRNLQVALRHSPLSQVRYISDFFKSASLAARMLKMLKRRQRTQAQSSDRRHGQKPLLLQQACMSLTFDLWEHWMLQCHILYTSTDMTSLFSTGQRSHFTHRESEWMHELTLNIRFLYFSTVCVYTQLCPMHAHTHQVHRSPDI